MAICRVYLFTYKRNELLPRAIKSLQEQTMTDWVCEVHNDCPEDRFPEIFLKTIDDSRFALKDHDKNIGATASFNLAFAGCTEDYISILEDDNWWEPDFLTEMTSVMESRREISVAWSNMNIWRERDDRSWENTGQTVWPINNHCSVFTWPDFKQAMGALHSNGAMMFRSADARKYIIPNECDFNMMEAVRERTFEFPILLNSKVLANFSHTRQTSRSSDSLFWTGSQVLLLASFIKASAAPREAFKNALSYYRRQAPSPVANFFLANKYLIKDKSFYTLFGIKDWLMICKWLIKNSLQLTQLKRYLTQQETVYQFLLKNTANRSRQSERHAV